MKAVEVPSDAVTRMRNHARASYPDECCGFLISRQASESVGRRVVVSVEAAQNEFEGERRRRFEIRPEELRGVERRLEGSGTVVGGFYHSHPDHPATPSAFDQSHAWPWYSYLVIRVTAHSVGPVGAFELDEDSGEFHPAPLTLRQSPGWSTGKQTPMNLLDENEVP